jgi:hypothetical protein
VAEGSGNDGAQYGFGEPSNWSVRMNDHECYTADLAVLTPGTISDGRAVFSFPVETGLRIDIYEGGRQLKSTKTITFVQRSP